MRSVDLLVHRRRLIGSPAVVSSMIFSSARTSVGSATSNRWRPPPGWRTRPLVPRTVPAWSSRIPRRIVGRAIPVSPCIAFSPPRPIARASRATYQRAWASLSVRSTLSSNVASRAGGMSHREYRTAPKIVIVIMRRLLRSRHSPGGASSPAPLSGGSRIDGLDQHSYMLAEILQKPLARVQRAVDLTEFLLQRSLAPKEPANRVALRWDSQPAVLLLGHLVSPAGATHAQPLVA